VIGSNGSNPPAIVLGGGITALSVARSLAAVGRTVHVLDRGSSPARASRSVSAFVDVGEVEPQERMLEWLQSGGVRGVLLAGSDDGVELIARNRRELLEHGHHPVEGDDEALLAMLDKPRTYELARGVGISVPEYLPLPDLAAVEATIERLEFPCVLKPVQSHLFARRTGSPDKVIVAGSPSELRREWERLTSLSLAMFVTEVIVGDSDEFVSYYGYLDETGESLLHFTKRKIRQHPPGFGIGTYHETTSDPEVAEVGLRFLQAAGVRGLGNVEFKRDARDGRLTLIECNPRFTLSNELIRASGIDLALVSYNRALQLPPPKLNSYSVGLHLWDPVNDSRALLEYRRRGELSASGWLRSLMHQQRFPTLRIDDPMPTVARIRTMSRHAFSRRSPRIPAPSTGPAERRTGATGARAANRVMERLAQAGGRRGRAVASRLDLVASTGVGPAWRRVRAERLFSQLSEGTRDRLYERIWSEAAERCGAGSVKLSPGLLELRREDRRTRVYHQVVELDDPVTLQVALDKALVYELLAQSGVPHPAHVQWGPPDPQPAVAFLAHAGGPCVVKPAAGTGGGHGVVPGVRSEADLLRAMWHSARQVDRLLIERQGTGSVYRLLLLDGELLDVIRSAAPSVTGDGHSTIEQLIAAENERRVKADGAAGLSLLGLTLDTVLTLRAGGWRLDSVLPAGARVPIRVGTNNNAAEDNETWKDPVAAAVLEDARRAAEAVGLRLAGVDVITTDISRPLGDTGGVIAEVNGTPGLHHHYLVADPERATPVAVPVLQALLGLRSE